MSVYKRGKRWYYYIKISGARQRGAIPEARTKYQAEQAEIRIRNEIFEGRFGARQTTKTLREFVEETFLPWAKENKRSWRNDVSRAKPILAFFGKRRLVDISPFLVEKYKSERGKSKTRRGDVRAKATVNRELQLLSRIFTLAMRNKELRSNPCAEVEPFKGEVRRNRYLLPDEEKRLMAVLIGRRAHLRLIVLIALNTGMRRGEILRLRKQDVNFHRGLIHVTQTKIDEDRDVPMNEMLMNELMAHCANLTTDHLFVWPRTGKPIDDLKTSFTRACEKAKIEDLRFHDLRHTAATRMAEAGVDPFTIAEILGHKNITTTARYSHATASAKRRAVAALEAARQESGPQMGHKQEQRPLLTAVG
jgi:integrase